MRKKIWFLGSLFMVVVACFLIALPSAQAYSISITHDYGSGAGKVDPGGQDPLSENYVTIYDTDPNTGYKRFNDTFDFQGLFSEVTSFELTLVFSNTNNWNYWICPEDWRVRPGDSTTLLYMDRKGDTPYTQTFVFTSANTDTFNAMVAAGVFDLWFADKAAGANNFKLYSATLTINGTEAAVPIPGAAWLLGSGLVGLVGLRRKFRIGRA
jgi:uncharacterized Zn-binding protein involved in type VI secretion